MIGVQRHGVFLGADGEEDVRDARSHRRRGVLADPQRHGRPAVEDVQQVPRVLRVAEAVVGQVPVQTVHAGIGVASAATLPVLEADRGIEEEHLAPPLPGQSRLRPQGNLCDRGGGGRLQIDDREGIGEVLGHIGPIADDGHAPRTVAGKLHALPQRGQKGKVVGHFGRRSSIKPAELVQQGRGVDPAQLVCAGVGHEDRLAVAAGRHTPRQGRAQIDVVEENRIEQLPGRGVDDAHGVRVDPAPLQLRGRQLEVREHVYHVDITAVGRNSYAADAGTAVGQADRCGLVAGRVDRR